MLLISALVMSLSAMAQDVVDFEGVAVDGSEQEMIQSLQQKGFSYNKKKGLLTGMVDGQKVVVELVSHEGKVYEVAAMDNFFSTADEARNRFNDLANRCLDDKNTYMRDFGVFYISADEDINENIDQYIAAFAILPKVEDVDTAAIMRDMTEMIMRKYSVDNVDSLTEDQTVEAAFMVMAKMLELVSQKKYRIQLVSTGKKNKYRIIQYYINGYNKPKDEHDVIFDF